MTIYPPYGKVGLRTMKGSPMIYDFILINGDDRGSIRPVRTYKTENSLSKKFIESINTVLSQAFRDTGLVAGENNKAYLEFDKAWVEKSKDDERVSMLLADGFMIDTVGSIDSQYARIIAKQLLEDLASTDDWEVIFEGTADAFTDVDFNKFSVIDNTIGNTDLKVPIGANVYVRGWYDHVFVYQGRPTRRRIKEEMNPFILSHEVWATDDEIIAVDDINVNDYADKIETFPLPLGHRDKYFSREKKKDNTRKEAFGMTPEQSKLRLAIMIALNEDYN